SKAANREKLALWCTFHPTQVPLERFLMQCHTLNEQGIRYSVGIVGTKEALAFLEPLRAGLSPGIYIWVNAYKREPDFYSPNEIAMLSTFDPLFHLNNRRHPSFG